MRADVTAARPQAATSAELPLMRRFPSLAVIPRARLGVFPSPVERVEGFHGVDTLWIKRDDLNAPDVGGNKVRSLEFLLGRVTAGDTVLTVGGEGSTHVLATAAHAARLGARTVALRWRHEMHPVSKQVGARAASLCVDAPVYHNIVFAMASAYDRRLRSADHYIPLGGSIPLGILGQVSAALELAEQVAAGQLQPPRRVVVPLGTGSTAAGLALGFAIAGLNVTVVGARAGPRIGSNRWRVLWLARRTAQLIQRYTGRRLPRVDRRRVEVMHEVYGGAYGRPHPQCESAAAMLRGVCGVRLDATYSAKAFAAALEVAGRGEPTLYWLTFDARWMQGTWAVS